MQFPLILYGLFRCCRTNSGCHCQHQQLMLTVNAPPPPCAACDAQISQHGASYSHVRRGLRWCSDNSVNPPCVVDGIVMRARSEAAMPAGIAWAGWTKACSTTVQGMSTAGAYISTAWSEHIPIASSWSLFWPT